VLSDQTVAALQADRALAIETDYTWPSEDENHAAALGMFYDVSYAQWKRASGPGDRALVIVRDPRDLIVSWAYSATYSHFSNWDIRTIRPVLLNLDLQGRLRIALHHFCWRAPIYHSWVELVRLRETQSEYFTTYERLVERSFEEFQNILAFFQLAVPAERLHDVLKRHSFQARSGRPKGQSNVLSHYRRGVAGDWRNYFDREFGELFEGALPGLLTDFQYELSAKWYESLPASLPAVGETEQLPADEIALLQADNRQLSEENAVLRRFYDTYLAWTAATAD